MTEPVIDWERKFHEQVSDNIRAKAVASAKLADAYVRLDQATARVAALRAQVERMTPAADKLRASEAAREEESVRCAKTILEADARTRAAKADLLRGQRGVIEDVIQWLHAAAAKMPGPKTEQYGKAGAT